MTEICDQQDNDCDGFVDEGFDVDNDGFTTCSEDCNDADPQMNPNAAEVLDQKDNNCDGKVDNHIAGNDYDKDGVPYPTDCNDDEPLVGPSAIEVAGDGVDNNCNNAVDEATPSCEPNQSSTAAADLVKAVELCIPATVTVSGNSSARNIRPSFGATTGPWKPKAGSEMLMLSSGSAVDRVLGQPLGNSSYSPQDGTDFGTGLDPYDITDVKIVLKVPQNAKSFSFDFAFFSAEFPEYVGAGFNDKFQANLTSKALPTTGYSAATCPDSFTGCRTGNISFDGSGKPISVDNNYFLICKKETSGSYITQTSKCTQPVSMLTGTGYELIQTRNSYTGPVGGSTGWLSTKAPVTPGETIELHFRIFDSGDGILDSAVLIDNFKWDATPVTAPTTDPIN